MPFCLSNSSDQQGAIRSSSLLLYQAHTRHVSRFPENTHRCVVPKILTLSHIPVFSSGSHDDRVKEVCIVLRCFEAYRLSSMGQERLSSLALLHIQYLMPVDLDAIRVTRYPAATVHVRNQGCCNFLGRYDFQFLWSMPKNTNPMELIIISTHTHLLTTGTSDL